MPLVKCPGCGREVSRKAISCPNCGHPVAESFAWFQKTDFKFLQDLPKAILGLLIIIGIIMAASNSGKQSSHQTTEQNSTAPEKTPPKPPTQADLCRSDWTKCADNEQLVNNYSNWSNVQVECQYAANARAKYEDPVWPWLPFGSFYKGKITSHQG